MKTITDPKTIETVALTHVDDVSATLRAEVLERARKEFGYAADTFGHQGPLAQALMQAEVTPLKTADVQQYMKSKERAWVSHRAWLMRAVMLVSPALAGIGVIWATHNKYFNFGKDSVMDFMSFVLLLVASGVGTVILNVVYKNPVSDREYKRYWREYGFGDAPQRATAPEGGTAMEQYNRNMAALRTSQILGQHYAQGIKRSSYNGYIPVHILNLALQVREACPEANFVIHELTLSMENVPKPLPDPFLSVTLGSEEYFIGVWDERDFEARA